MIVFLSAQHKNRISVPQKNIKQKIQKEYHPPHLLKSISLYGNGNLGVPRKQGWKKLILGVEIICLGGQLFPLMGSLFPGGVGPIIPNMDQHTTRRTP